MQKVFWDQQLLREGSRAGEKEKLSCGAVLLESWASPMESSVAEMNDSSEFAWVKDWNITPIGHWMQKLGRRCELGWDNSLQLGKSLQRVQSSRLSAHSTTSCWKTNFFTSEGDLGNASRHPTRQCLPTPASFLGVWYLYKKTLHLSCDAHFKTMCKKIVKLHFIVGTSESQEYEEYNKWDVCLACCWYSEATLLLRKQLFVDNYIKNLVTRKLCTF